MGRSVKERTARKALCSGDSNDVWPAEDSGIREANLRSWDGERERDPKKGYCSLDVGFTEQLKLVNRLQVSYPITVLCELFGVCRSSYKYWRSRRRVINANKVKLRALVSEKHELSNGAAGSRSIASMVLQDGTDLSRYRARPTRKHCSLILRYLTSWDSNLMSPHQTKFGAVTWPIFWPVNGWAT